MDISKNSLDSAASNASITSLVTSEVPPNKNKDSLEYFDDSMLCKEDWLDYDVDDENEDEKNQSDTAETPLHVVTEEIPPKKEVTFASPKRKKTKFPNFDELLQNLNFDILNLYFAKLLLFLESSKKELAFPFTLKEYEEFFKMIVEDVNILKSKSLDECYRDICDKISKAATGYLLTYVYEHKTDFDKKVMVIKKENNNMMDQSEDSTAPFSGSKECVQEIKASSQKSREVDTKKHSKPKKSPIEMSPISKISSGFKIHCLRTLLAFIKYDEIKTKEFPELSPDQAHYMQSLLENEEAFYEGTFYERNLEVKELCTALREAMKIYSLKYDYKINCVDSWWKKNLIFEKIPKQKSGTDGDSNQEMNLIFEKIPKQKSVTESGTDGDSNQAMNPKSETSKTETSKSETSKTETSKTETSKTETRHVAEHCFKKPETPMFNPVQQRPMFLTKRMLRRQIKAENEVLVVKNLPPEVVSDTLNSIIEFLLDDKKFDLVFVPKNLAELCFYRKVFNMCKTGCILSNLGEEFEILHYRILALLSLPHFNIKATASKRNRVNATTGIKEVTYLKKFKFVPVDMEYIQSAPKRKKVNLQNVLELAGTEQIRLASVIDLNQSLRNKKKNKKQKKDKLNKANAIASKGASPKSANMAKSSTDDSSSECSSRSASRDRTRAVPKAQPVTRRAANENNQSVRFRRGEEVTRQEQLMEALSVPVQSDRAMRMMRGMGWRGGALGARGEGITEPLMPKLNIARGAGLGHSRSTQPETIARKSKETKTAPSWVSENQKVIEKVEDDIIVKKTKELLLENPTFDDLMKPSQSKSKVELPKPVKANVELPKPVKANVELPKPIKVNVELSKPVKPDTYEIVPENFTRMEFLTSIYAFLNTDAPYKTLNYRKAIPIRARKFVKNTLSVINKRKVNYSIFQKEEFSLYTQIQVKYKNMHQTFIEANVLRDHKTIELTRIPTDPEAAAELQTERMQLQNELMQLQNEQMQYEQRPTERISIERMPTEFKGLSQQELSLPSSKAKSLIITEECINSHILSTNTHCDSHKGYSMLKFKVLFLMNILNFVKSLNEESEVTFNKILNQKEKCYIQDVIDELNMRINFGSSPAEKKLCQDIKEHVKGAFLVPMFNHQYTVVTLNKYFRFKRLNRPDNAVKRKCQTTFDLDIYKSETVSQDNINISEPTERENNDDVADNNNVAKKDNTLAENYSEVAETSSTVSEDNNKVVEKVLPESLDDDITIPYDSDASSVEECDNNAIATVPKLPPGEEGVNLSKYLYDKEKPNPTCVKNTNYITNEISSKVTENINNKNNVSNRNVVIDNNDNQTVDMEKAGRNTKNIDNMAENVNNAVDTDMSEYIVCVDYTAEVIRSNEITGDTRKEKIMITGNQRADLNEPIKCSDTVGNDVEDFKSHYENWEDIAKDDIFFLTGNPSKNIKDPEFIMKEDVIEKMEGLVKVNSKGETSNIKEESSINPSDGQNVKQEAKNVDIKTDCGRLTKEKIVLSDNNCDTQSVAVKAGTETDVSNTLKDSEIKLVRIVHINHPFTKLTKERITEIQRDICNSIILSTQLPLLKCHGVQMDALIYTCHNKKTYDWLQNTISVASYVKVLSADEVTKMALKFYCLFDYNCLYVCKMIELYNKGLSTKKWVVEKTEKDGDYVTFIIKMDKISVKYIQESDFALFAGVDKVQFSPIWE